jgi:hypothetical protein
MELLKDIYFNTDKLVENTNVKVSYTGKFYQGDNDKVFIHYGYGQNWDNIQEVEMQKTDLGYQAELNLAGNDTINFCFKNQNNEWDNNFGENYIFNIEKSSVNDLGITTFGSQEPVVENNFESIVTPSANELNTIINPISELTSNKQETANVDQQPVTSLAVQKKSKSFGYWTKKVTDSIINFFAAVPKIITGNYKRNVKKAK